MRTPCAAGANSGSIGRGRSPALVAPRVRQSNPGMPKPPGPRSRIPTDTAAGSGCSLSAPCGVAQGSIPGRALRVRIECGVDRPTSSLRRGSEAGRDRATDMSDGVGGEDGGTRTRALTGRLLLSLAACPPVSQVAAMSGVSWPRALPKDGAVYGPPSLSYVLMSTGLDSGLPATPQSPDGLGPCVRRKPPGGGAVIRIGLPVSLNGAPPARPGQTVS